MSIDELTGQKLAAPRREGPSVVTAVLSVLLILVVLGCVAAAVWLFLTGSAYKDGQTFALLLGVEAVALVALAALPRSTPHLGVVLGLAAVPGILALGFLFFGMLIAWTGEVHTFASSWGPIGRTYALMAPVFAPLLVSLAAIILRKRSARVRVLSVLGIAAALVGLAVPGLAGFIAMGAS